ncbi:MAG: ribose-phosphate pyrophosphokinase [Candidatus Riflebacteria bacterium]|nr:ribose-phosphate pyrophosphokinase [Candidatus Riflebacteria bacterium]
MIDTLKIFAGSSHPTFAEEICRALGIMPGRLDISRFSNDNLSIQVQENVRERDVFVVQSFTEPVSDHILELFIILDALRSASAKRITAVVPYFSYARSDKKDAPRISITGRLLADLLASAGANRVLTMDLHSDQVHGFFSVPVDHLTAIPLIASHIRKQFPLDQAVAVATDAGAAKRVGRFAEYLNIPMAIIDKRRLSDTKVKHGLVVGEVAGRDAFVFDDEIAAASTVVSTVKILQEAGCRNVYAAATHAVLCGPAVERLRDCPVQGIIGTNTVFVPEAKRLPKISTISVAPLFAEAIKRIHTGESVGALFT